MTGNRKSQDKTGGGKSAEKPQNPGAHGKRAERKEMKKLKEHAVYSDVVEAGLILQKKEKYTVADVKKLIKSGWGALDALWIVKCSWVFHKSKISQKLLSNSFFTSCELEMI